jgi:hypothetical protein
MRRTKICGAHAGEVTVALIVGEENDQVWLSHGLFSVLEDAARSDSFF